MNLQWKEIIQQTQRNFSFFKACLHLGKKKIIYFTICDWFILDKHLFYLTCWGKTDLDQVTLYVMIRGKGTHFVLNPISQ